MHHAKEIRFLFLILSSLLGIKEQLLFELPEKFTHRILQLMR